MDILIKVKGIPLTLDGRQFILPPANFAILEHFGEILDGVNARLMANGGIPLIKDMAVIADLVHACLRRNYPDVTREFVGDQLGLEENPIELIQKCMDGGGAFRKALEAAAQNSAAQGGGTLGESTGTSSSPTS